MQNHLCLSCCNMLASSHDKSPLDDVRSANLRPQPTLPNPGHSLHSFCIDNFSRRNKIPSQPRRCDWWGEDTNRIAAERLRPKNTTSQGCEEKARLVGGPGLFHLVR